jgi:hypothetical protein
MHMNIKYLFLSILITFIFIFGCENKNILTNLEHNNPLDPYNTGSYIDAVCEIDMYATPNQEHYTTGTLNVTIENRSNVEFNDVQITTVTIYTEYGYSRILKFSENTSWNHILSSNESKNIELTAYENGYSTFGVSYLTFTVQFYKENILYLINVKIDSSSGLVVGYVS